MRVSSRGGMGHQTESSGWSRPMRPVRSVWSVPVVVSQTLAVQSLLAVAQR